MIHPKEYSPDLKRVKDKISGAEYGYAQLGSGFSGNAVESVGKFV